MPGWTWAVRPRQFERAFSLLERFVRREGHARVPQPHVETGVKLGAWVARVRRKGRGGAKGRLSGQEIERLEGLPGWTWGRSRRR
jgi:hypothetical protein